MPLKTLYICCCMFSRVCQNEDAKPFIAECHIGGGLGGGKDCPNPDKSREGIASVHNKEPPPGR